MTSLYVVGLPAGDGADLTLRARRVIESAVLLAAADPQAARMRLLSLGIDAPVVAPAGATSRLAAAEGAVALLVDGLRAGVDEVTRQFVGAGLAAGLSVEPVPGPVLPLTALVVSGLPADSFVYLGALPGEAAARDALLGSVAAERRTLVVVAAAAELAGLVTELRTAWGDRPLVIVPASSEGGPTWRGSLDRACEALESLPTGGDCALVLGGATEEPAAWDEGRLEAAIDRRAARGEGAKQISQALAGVSGWSRREIYRRAIARTGTRPHG
jgi:16S rRNA (cytidine1402-2'-O)-methyltransferase